MTKQNKLFGDERRDTILKWLIESTEPLTGGDLAERTHVSRQVIVQDISLLKAKGLPIIPTSQGYIYFSQTNQDQLKRRVIASKHQYSDTEDELTIIVDKGVIVKDVIVDHPIYGELTASLLIRSRSDVMHFIKKLTDTNASLLSALTEGTHLHTLEAPTEKALDEACQALEKAGYLLPYL